MEYLLGNSEEIERIRGEEMILMMLDFDGTLSPIVDDPDDAVLPEETKGILEDLGRTDHITLAIISGRGINDLKNRVGIEGIIYVGNHGMETEGTSPLTGGVSHRLDAIEEVSRRLIDALGTIEGIIIEDKGLSISIHYRKAHSRDEHHIKKVVGEVVEPHKDTLTVFHGRKVTEVRPKGAFDKGDLVAHLAGLYSKALPIYIGDDTTDEDAFRALPHGITINARRNAQNTAASYFLDGPLDVMAFLELII